MICPTCRGRQFIPTGSDDDDDDGCGFIICPDCIGGIASCCDAAGSSSPSFACPRCGAVSYNPNDIRERYCGRCHAFVDDAAEQERAEARRDERQRNMFDGYSEAEIERSQRRIAAILGELPDDDDDA